MSFLSAVLDGVLTEGLSAAKRYAQRRVKRYVKRKRDTAAITRARMLNIGSNTTFGLKGKGWALPFAQLMYKAHNKILGRGSLESQLRPIFVNHYKIRGGKRRTPRRHQVKASWIKGHTRHRRSR